MKPFIWSPSLETQIPLIDEQHQRRFDVINRFGAALTESDTLDPQRVEAVFGEVMDYTKYHFAAEEAVMDEGALGPDELVGHRAQHATFLADVTRMHDALRPEDRVAAERLLQYLTQWLVYHILGSDLEMARRVAAHRGSTAQAAPTSSRPGVQEGEVTALLLHALEGLFQVVHQRNHELSELTRSLEERVVARTEELAVANARLESLAMTDALTGLANRRHAMARLASRWTQLEGAPPLSVILIDADDFKRVNDELGHEAGDEVLRSLAADLRDAVRTDDLVCRLGGDELLIICDDTPLEGAIRLAETVRARVAALRLSARPGAWRGSLSIGVATRGPGMERPEELLNVADLGVYAAKAAGKGRVCCVQMTPVPAFSAPALRAPSRA